MSQAALYNALIEEFRCKANIPSWELERLLRESNQDNLNFSQRLIKEEWLDRDTVGRMYGDYVHCTYVNLDKTLFNQDIVKKLPRGNAEKLRAVPVYKFGAAVTVAMAQPGDLQAIRELEQAVMAPVSPIFSFPDEIAKAIEINYMSNDNVGSLIQEFSIKSLQNKGGTDKEKVDRLAGSNQLIKLADALIVLAIKDMASDVHIETKKHSIQVRFRIDGVMVDKFTLPKELSAPLVARYKVMARMDVIDHRKPQDGRLTFQVADESVDVRISTLPTLHGEKVVFRILGSRFTRDMLDLDKMSIFPEILQSLKKVLANPDGMLLVSGPTGSGKTTTLAAALNYVNHPGINVVTIEDPVEYENPAINQVMASARDGNGFNTVLKAVLRQDPDVILVGEVRDLETARIVAQAALTGHLVMSTIHTGSALLALTRLLDIGVERFIVAPSIIGVMGQHLVRRICEHCKKLYRPDPEYLNRFFYWRGDLSPPNLYRGEGCDHCHGTGYKGRMGVHEFLKVDTVIRDAIIGGCELHELKAIARQRGFKDARYDGYRKALLGLTTIEEVNRVTSDGA